MQDFFHCVWPQTMYFSGPPILYPSPNPNPEPQNSELTADHIFSRAQNFCECREASSNRENILLAKDRNLANIFV